VAAPVLRAPAVPKPSPFATPALPKGKLDALVPILLVINTFLLLLILAVLLFIGKAK
jgi:hypothetical protein